MEKIVTYLFDLLCKNILLVVLTIISSVYPYLNIDSFDRVVFLDVGQGDAILITTNAGANILIDCGPGDYVVQKLGEYLAPGDMHLDLLVLTHPHADHILGYTDIAKRYSVSNVWIYGDCLQYANINNKDLVGEGAKFVLLNLAIEVIYPRIKETLKLCVDSSRYNDISIVMEVKINNLKILLMGDATIEVEDYLISRKRVKEGIDILKAGHHCSSTSSSREFLEYVSPRIAICSVGENNKFGHPSESVLRLFDELGIKYLSTAIEGDIVIDI